MRSCQDLRLTGLEYAANFAGVVERIVTLQLDFLKNGGRRRPQRCAAAL